MTEIWKDIKDFEGLYQISNLGKVKSLPRYVKNIHGQRIVKEKILKNQINKKGYYSVVLRKNNKSYTKEIHRLIGIAFIENKNNYSCINHIDGNKLNNKLDNLEWCSYKHNINEAYRLGLNRYTNLINFKNLPKKVLQFDKNNNFINEFESIRKASKITNVCYNSIWLNCCGKQRYAGGYTWKFKEEI